MPNEAEELIEQLYDMVQKAFAFPIGQDRCLLDRDKVLGILDELRETLPNDIKTARKIVQDRNDVLASAKREAEATKRQAEEHARRMTSQEEVIQTARRKAAEIIQNAELKSKEIQLMATDYLDSALKKTEEAIAASLGDVRKTRGEFRTAMSQTNKAKPEKPAE